MKNVFLIIRIINDSGVQIAYSYFIITKRIGIIENLEENNGFQVGCKTTNFQGVLAMKVRRQGRVGLSIVNEILSFILILFYILNVY